MASILIRRLDDSTKARLRVRAARHGRSMEAEAREILKAGLSRPSGHGKDLFERIHSRFAALGGFELPEIPRDPMREPPTFE
jgi:plasmid stability protein